MENIIKELYCIYAERSGNKLKNNPRYIKAISECDKIHTKFNNTINKRQKEWLDKYYDLMIELNACEMEQSFEEGFITGVRIMEYAHKESLFEKQV